ncbi:MAG: hydrogenase expression/formation protein HypE [Bacillota bacterium]
MKRISLGHGAGGSLTAGLLDNLFLPELGLPGRAQLGDAAWTGRGMAFTTDAFVVDPPVFPGGDIGRLALCGTVNDLAVSGARPLAVSAAFILEEGVELGLVRQVVRSMAGASREAGVPVVGGDIKVVGRRQCHRLYVVTSGIGRGTPGRVRRRARPKDKVLVSGPVGDHGAAVAWARLGMPAQGAPVSDCAPLWEVVAALLERCPGTGPMRDPTRGGLATALLELAESSSVGVELEEAQIPLGSRTRAATSVLGLDPLYLACEGRLVVFARPDAVDGVLDVLKSYHPAAAVIGTVTRDSGQVLLKTAAGGLRRLQLETEGQLPRIC